MRSLEHLRGMSVTEATMLQKGVAAAKGGDETTARYFLQKVVDLSPGNEVAWMWLAFVAEDGIQAINYLRQVLDLNPRNDQAMTGLHNALLQEGIALAKVGSKAQARVMLLEASTLNPANDKVWMWLATVAERPGDAMKALQKALKINPHNEQAIARLNQIHTVPDIPEVINQCPLCAAVIDEKLTACPACKAVITVDQVGALVNNPQADRSALLKAVKRFQDLVAEREDYFAYVNLGLALLNLGQLPQGIAALENAVILQPEDERLIEQLELLKRRYQQVVQAAGSRTIMVIDDSATVCKLVSTTLERNGHRVLTAGEMMEAMGKINEVKLDLILLDICLPGIDGYQICKVVKGYESTKDVPVVMLSGKDGIFDKMRAKLVGANGYITKPFVPSDLVKAVETYCKQEGRK